LSVVVEIALAGDHARAVIEGGFGVVVDGVNVGAPCDFFEVTQAVVIEVEEAVTGAVIVGLRNGTRAIISGCGRVVVASKCVGAP
jgi:hypothetical protein